MLGLLLEDNCLAANAAGVKLVEVPSQNYYWQ
ncbi:MAG: hypothetical protein RJB68_417 [Pseudomonadota bacterium]|jgi:hypothetical protein